MGVAVTCSTLMWPVNRWALARGGRPEVYGFWIGAFGAAGAGEARRASARWAFWALLTFQCAGLSMSTQLVVSLRAPEAPLPLACAYLATAAAFLLPIVLVGRRKLLVPRQMAAGAANGLMQTLAVSCMLLALRTLGPEVVFPFSVGLPVILALLLGALVYHERIDRAGWAGSALGVVGLILISVVK